MMSKSRAQIRAYARKSHRYGIGPQIKRLQEAGAAEVYENDDLHECIRSLLPGDTFAVTTLDRIASTRDAIRAAVVRILEKGVTILEVDTGRTISPECAAAAMAVFDGLDTLTNDRRRMTPDQARAAALLRHSRTPTVKAEAIWRNTTDYPTAAEALEHEDMAGWTEPDARRKFGARGNAVRRKQPKR